jgi:SET domain-containing protein
MILIEETDERFYLKKSTVPNAGLGVFTRTFIPKGEYLEIIGIMVKTNSMADNCTHYADKYKFAANGKTRQGKYETDFSRKIVPIGLGGIVNHSPTKEQQNAEIFYRNGPNRNSASGKAVYRFIRDIEPNEEVLGSYGEEWLEIMDWAENKAEDISNTEDEWETFLSYDLYNLGQLRKDFDYKEQYA